MIKKFDLIAGTKEEIRDYIERDNTFFQWQLGKDYNSQIERLLNRSGFANHIGAVTYQGVCDDGVVIHGAFVAVMD